MAASSSESASGHGKGNSQEPAGAEQQQQQKKRKKAARACNHCQTAHLTCDDNRPCLRCLKRGLGDTCQDGARKKAKYLRDIEDALVNAGKAVPTHFIHSPPPSNQEINGPGASTTEEATTKSTSKPSSQRNGSNSSQKLANEKSTRQSSDVSPAQQGSSLPPLPPPPPQQQQQQQQHFRQPTQSPAQFTNASLPTPTAAPHSALHASPSIDVPPPSDDSINNTHSHLPPNAYSNTPSNLLNFESSTSSTSQIQPFNFFNDLNLGGLGGLGGSGNSASDFLTTNNSANLEYAVLSSMLQNSGYGNTSPMGFNDTLSSGSGNNGNTGSGHQRSNNSMSMYQGIFTGSDDYGTMSFGFPPAAFENTANNGNSHSGNNDSSTASLNMIPQSNNSPTGITSFLPGTNTNNNNSGSTGDGRNQQHMPALQAPTNSFGALPIDHNWPTIASTIPNGHDNNNQQHPHPSHHQQAQHLQPHHPNSHQDSSSTSAGYNQHNAAAHLAKTKPTISSTGVMKVEDVYKHINKPYNYLEAYHALIRYLQSHFENKSSVLRIIRSLAIYRPSIIALHMPLTQDDEIFVERSFQRTLIELEKLISFSGTPTLVWRRTGEIVLVGTEFTLLSEWRREDLLSKDRAASAADQNSIAAQNAQTGNTGIESVKEKKLSKGKKRYIFEIFDQDSLVGYYESFAQHAFESSSATIMFTCSIVTPKGRKVPCTFGYNLKRDIFGLPQMIIGQFLPILTSADDPTT